jgi:hypothetical protein
MYGGYESSLIHLISPIYRYLKELDMRSRYLVIFVLGLSVVNQIDAQENEAIENIIVSASKMNKIRRCHYIRISNQRK